MYMIQCTSVLFRLHDVICMQAAFYPVFCDFVMGPFKCYVTQMGVGGGVPDFLEKSVTKV